MSSEECEVFYEYVKGVDDETTLACKWVRLACRRHIDDYEHRQERGIWFDEHAAQYAIDFFPAFLVFYEGIFDGKPFNLEPWQQFIVGSLFGWKTDEGVRRFRTAYLEIGKGNGKSPMAAGIGLYGLTMDDEPGAEIYAAATQREQAGILFRDAKAFVDGSAALKRNLDVGISNIANIGEKSFFRPVSSEHRGLDGKRPHIALIDEIHEHPNSTVVDKMRAGTKGRSQALIFEITNAGYDRQSICYQHHELSEKILQRIVDNDSWFAYMTGLDVCPECEADGKTIPTDGCENCDQWTDEKVWIKANPNLGVSIMPKYIREHVDEAVEMPPKQSLVKRLNMCIWTEGITTWIPVDKWNACSDSSLQMEDYKGKPCYLGVDLASKIDICALSIVFMLEDRIASFGKYYLPEDTIRESKNEQYARWVREGHMIQTPGAITDFKFIEDDLKAINAVYPIAQLGFDPREAGYLINNVMEWTKEDTCVEITQGPAQMNEPMKELEARVYSKRILHDGNPVMSWMVSNVVLKESRGGPVKYYYPTKTNNENKIDGVVALVMAIGRGMTDPGPKKSVYATRGLSTV